MKNEKSTRINKNVIYTQKEKHTCIIIPKFKIQILTFHSNNAVTLISLIITIIVLLILTGVAINLAVNQEDLFNKATQSATEWNTALQKENEDINNLIEIVENEGPVDTSGIDALEVSKNATLYYGKIVENYDVKYDNTEETNNWRIFYADGEDVAEEDRHIYLITDDYIHYDYAPDVSESANGNKVSGSDYKLYFPNVIGGYEGSKSIGNNSNIRQWLSKYLSYENNAKSTNNNINAVAYMLDTSIWTEKFANNKYADYAIGGPTLEMFCASYNDTHLTKWIECYVEDSNGYKIKWSDGSSYDDGIYIGGLEKDEFNNIYRKSDNSKAKGMWISSPSANSANELMGLYYYGRVSYYSYRTNNEIGIRVIACLKSNIKLKDQGNGNYKIIE